MTVETSAGRSGRLLSVNVGAPRVVEWGGRQVVSSIWKAPVQGRVAVAGTNVAGDLQADSRVHGGPDKAVYAYAIEDYRWWEAKLHSDLAPGTFGENLTVQGIDLRTAVVGEVWVVGTARLQVTEPRLPCFKLGMRMGDAGFAQRFDRARRYGVYLRITGDGEVGAGDAIELVSRPAHGLTATFIAEVHATKDPEHLQRLVETEDVTEGWREWAARQLDKRRP